MAERRAASPIGKTSRRFMPKIRCISAVHRPTPFIAHNLSITSSSDSVSSSAKSSSSFTRLDANSPRNSLFLPESPALVKSIAGTPRNDRGQIGRPPHSVATRLKIVWAALPDNCCPTIALANESNPPVFSGTGSLPTWRITCERRLSRLASQTGISCQSILFFVLSAATIAEFSWLHQDGLWLPVD